MMNFTCLKKRGFILLFLVSFFVVNAQEYERYTQYFYNPTGINPAYAGAKGFTTFLGTYRAQWVGVPGAPKTAAISINGAASNKNIGWGVSIMNDEIGPSVQNSIAADFAYQIKLNSSYRLSFGLKASANLLDVDFTKLYLKDGSEPTFQDNVQNKFSPNVGVGLLIHSDKTSIGISVPNLLATKFYDKYSSSVATSSITKENLNVFLTADHLFELDYFLKFKPSLLVKIIQDGAIQTYTSATFLVNDKFTLGMSYRFGGTISNLAGFQVSDRMFIGYGYDLETKMMRNYSTGSHEIFIRFDFLPKSQKRTMFGSYF